eukprot:83171_1
MECTTLEITIATIFTLLASSALITIIYFGYRIIKAKCQQKPSKRSHLWKHILFLITTFMVTSIYPYYPWINCYHTTQPNKAYDIIILSTFACSWGLHNLFMAVLFFSKFVSIFDGTPMQIAKQTVMIYHVIFAILGCFVIVYAFLAFLVIFSGSELVPVPMLFCASLYFLLWIILMISMGFLFIKKLIAVYKMDVSGDMTLVNAITKVSVLTIIVTSISVINIIIIPIANNIHRTLFTLTIADFVGLIDIYTNFINVMMNEKIFTVYYQKICCLMDRKCHYCWLSLIDGYEVSSDSGNNTMHTTTHPAQVTADFTDVVVK